MKQTQLAYILAVGIGLAWSSNQSAAQEPAVTDAEPAVTEPAATPSEGTTTHEVNYETSDTELYTPPVDEEPTKKKGGLVGGVHVGVPVFVNVPNDVVRPGAAVQFWGGYDIGFFVFGFDMGFGWTPVDLSNTDLPSLSDDGRSPLHRIFFGPEIRFQIPDLKIFLPYISTAFDINFWNFHETDVACGYWYCAEVSVYEFSPGLSTKVGTGIEIKPGFLIDLGLKFGYTAEGQFFNDSQKWFEPYVGIQIRRF